MSHNYWLLKSEGDCYSIDDLEKDTETAWTGIRNYQSRNFMMRDMKIGDVILFYHSNGDSKQAYMASLTYLEHHTLTKHNSIHGMSTSNQRLQRINRSGIV